MRYLILFITTLLFGVSVNDYRQKVGLNPLVNNSYLTNAAKNHAIYLYTNNIFSHYENPNFNYFTGIKPSDRAIYSGYNSRYVLENLSKGEKNYSESIKDLFSAIYHRLGFLDFNINEIGFYKIKDFFVYEMGNSYINKACIQPGVNSGYIEVCKDKKHIISKKIFNYQSKNNPKVVFWPYNGMQNVPAVFYDEIPDPLPNYGVCGYPISISFNPYYFKSPKLIYFKLYSDKELNTKILTSQNDVNHKLKDTEFVLFPLQRLEYGKRYYVKAKFIDDKEYYFEWSFKVETKNNIITIVSKKEKVYIKPNKTYLVYFKPLNRNDIIKKLRYSYLSNMKVNKISYKDANSIYINLSGSKGDKLTLTTSNREITFIIK